ncbi:hypothetical protein GCM10028791_36450 [Echinicola sediminis]
MKKHDIKLSPQFKAQTAKAVITIALFAFTYLMILILAMVLTALCIYGGVMLIVTYPRIVTIGLGIGLGSLGVFVLIFLLKFIFKSHKVDRSHLYEITRTDEPKLFELIDELVDEIGTSFPKKVYLSSDVNAAVFYDSSFWSMFLPVKKNLQIGLGLVNTVTNSELKAILAHEFGHFSQKTMKLGSHVYNVNQVIFNMLYENDSYDKLVGRWADASGYFAIFVVLAVKITQAIQWVLRKMYEVVNKSYMGLSREMEFHADEIAANVTGNAPLKSSLLRMNLADHSLTEVLSFYEEKIPENLKSSNVFREQQYVLDFLARYNDMPIENNLPKVAADEWGKFNKSKLVIKNQWASHPSIEDRIARLEKSNISFSEVSHNPANEIFVDIENTQQKLTTKMFREVKYTGEVSVMSLERFQEAYENDFNKNTFSKIYNAYYDNKSPSFFDVDSTYNTEDELTLEGLFSDQKVDLVYTSFALQNDIQTLAEISSKTIPTKTFDYDGRKYRRKESQKLAAKLKLELEKIDTQIKEHDIRIFKFFSKQEDTSKGAGKLKELYRAFFSFDQVFDKKYEVYTKLSKELAFVSETTPTDEIRDNFRRIISLEEQLKEEIKELLQDGGYAAEITKEIRENFELYLSKQWKYFGNETYFEENLEVLFAAMNNYAYLMSRGYFLLKKKLLNYQTSLVKRPYGLKVVNNGD